MKASLGSLIGVAWAAGTAAAVIAVAVLLVGGYFESTPHDLSSGQRTAHRSLAAVYWSGDMGVRMGAGVGLVKTLQAHGIPVLSVSSSVLFGWALSGFPVSPSCSCLQVAPPFADGRSRV